MALAAFCRFLHAVVAEFRRVFQGLRHAFTVHQLAAQGGDEHITRAMHLRRPGLPRCGRCHYWATVQCPLYAATRQATFAATEKSEVTDGTKL